MSSIVYQVHILLLEDYKSLKKGEIYEASAHSDNPGVGMGSVGQNLYKYWYNVWIDEKCENVIEVPEQYVNCIYNIVEYKKEQRNNKIKRLINGIT